MNTQKPSEVYLFNADITSDKWRMLKSSNLLTTLRFGEIAYDFKGKKITDENIKPIFIDKSEHAEMSRQLMTMIDNAMKGEV